MSAPLDAITIPTEGLHLIEASAGTGKTHTITSLFLRLIGQSGLPLEGIAAVTFTNAATEELKERVQKRLAHAVVELSREEPDPADAVVLHLARQRTRSVVRQRLEAALRVVDRVSIFTIHGFAARMLAQHAFESGMRTDLELLPDDRGIIYDVVTDFWASEVATLPKEEFAELGADAQHRNLTSVARTLASAFEVQLAAEARSSLDLKTCLERFRQDFEDARDAFTVSGGELEKLLVSSIALSRNKYRVTSVERDAALLRSYFEQTGPSARDYPDLEMGRWTRRKVQDGTKKGHRPPSHPLLDLLEGLREAAILVGEAAQQLGAELRARLAKEIERRLQQEHDLGKTQSFDGLLTGLLSALRRPEGGVRLAERIRQAYPAILIDEFQDTDRVQYEIFRRIAGTSRRGAALYLIGDPKQSIYRFRGADIQTYLRAARDPDATAWSLDVSYRSSPDLVRAQNALFGRGERAFAVPGIGYSAVRAAPQARNLLTRAPSTAGGGVPTKVPALRIVVCRERDPYQQAAAEVAGLLSSGLLLDDRPVRPSHIAVLTRTNKQAEVVQAHLRELGIPAVMHGDRSVFEAPEALELRRILRALAEPSQRTLSRAALATRLLGVSSSELFQMKDDVELLELWSGRLRAFGDLWRSRGVASALEALTDSVDLLPRTLREVDGERRLTNYRHLLELLHEAERREHLGVVGLLRWLDTAIAAPTGHAMAPESRQVRLESDEDAVTLTTAHKSKGLEYDLVVLPSVGAKEMEFSSSAVRFHDTGDQDIEKLEVRARKSSPEAEAHFEQARLEELEESLRVGYVALTRAKHQVTCLYQPTKGTSPLGWFLHEGHLPKDTTQALLSGLKSLDEEQKLSDLGRISTESEGCIAVLEESDVPKFGDLPLQNRTPFRGYSLVPPPAVPEVPRPVSTSSFSAMTRATESLSRRAREGRDVDEVTDTATLDHANSGTVGEVGTLAGQDRREVSPEAPTTAADSSSRVVLADFPRGAGPGNALHAVFEHLPFQGGTVEERRAVVREQLATFGYGEEDVARVAEAVENSLHVPLLPDGTRLIDLPVKSTVREMEFSLSVGREEKSSTLLSGGELGRALGTGTEPYVSLGYLKRVRDLGFGAFRGYLRGFIDLVFVSGGRFYVLDYKSNFLGDRYRDYRLSELQRSMEEHHYLLQGLLYGVAVERYAKQRLPKYEFHAHFGGIVYLFVRGVLSGAVSAEDAPPGVYFFRPSRRTMEALDQALRGEGQ